MPEEEAGVDDVGREQQRLGHVEHGERGLRHACTRLGDHRLRRVEPGDLRQRDRRPATTRSYGPARSRDRARTGRGSTADPPSSARVGAANVSATSASRSRARSESPNVYSTTTAKPPMRRMRRHAARGEQRAQEHDAVRGAEDRVRRALRVGHEADDVAAGVAHARDGVEAAVRVVDVAEHDPVLGAQLVERRRVAHVVALEVVDRDAQDGPDLGLVGQRALGGLDADLDGLAQELQARVLLQRARQQMRFGEHLEAVADADDRTAGRREFGDRVHHRREARDRARAQVVAVGEAAGHDDRVDAASSCRRRATGWCRHRRATRRPTRRPARSSSRGTGRRRLADSPGELRDRHLVGLDHRIRQQPLAHLLDLRARVRRRRSRRRPAGWSCRCGLRSRSCSRAPAARARRWLRPGRRSRGGGLLRRELRTLPRR